METALSKTGQHSTPDQVQNVLASLVNIINFSPHMRSYLSFRACGFTFREACGLAGVSESTVRRWKEAYPDFASLDQKEYVKELMDKFSYKYLEFEFLRNYRLVCKKDYDVLIKSISSPDSMSKQENDYLLKMRSHYTPEQLAVIQKLVATGGMEETSFTQLVLQYGQDKVLVTVGSKSG